MLLVFSADKTINGHLILLQLKPVQPSWHALGMAAGLDNEILEMVSESNSFIEVAC